MATIDVKHVYKLFGPQAAHARVLDLLRPAGARPTCWPKPAATSGSTT